VCLILTGVRAHNKNDAAEPASPCVFPPFPRPPSPRSPCAAPVISARKMSRWTADEDAALLKERKDVDSNRYGVCSRFPTGAHCCCSWLVIAHGMMRRGYDRTNVRECHVVAHGRCCLTYTPCLPECANRWYYLQSALVTKPRTGRKVRHYCAAETPPLTYARFQRVAPRVKGVSAPAVGKRTAAVRGAAEATRPHKSTSSLRPGNDSMAGTVSPTPSSSPPVSAGSLAAVVGPSTAPVASLRRVEVVLPLRGQQAPPQPGPSSASQRDARTGGAAARVDDDVLRFRIASTVARFALSVFDDGSSEPPARWEAGGVLRRFLAEPQGEEPFEVTNVKAELAKEIYRAGEKHADLMRLRPDAENAIRRLMALG
jgi:hypothetical protein